MPYAPGGLTDVVARLVAEQVRKQFAHGVIVENKPGASGIIAIEEMARARPDGHTLMIGNISTNGLTPILLAKRMRIDYDKDVQIVARLADVPVFFLATTTNFPPKTFAEFIAYAKAHPGDVRYASAGIGAYQHVNTEILAKRAGLDLLHIPFKDGGSAILTNVANGDIHVSWFNITNPVGMMQARPRASARGRGAAAAGRASRCSDHRRGRLSRPARGAMGRRLRAGAHAAGDRRDAARRVRHGVARAGGAGGVPERRHGRAVAILAPTTPKPGCRRKWPAGGAISRKSASSSTNDVVHCGLLRDIDFEDRNSARRRHRPRSRSPMHQGDEGGGRARRSWTIDWRPLPIGKSGHEQHGNTLPAVTEQALHGLDGWVMGPIGHAAYPRNDATWVMPPVRKKFDLFAAVRPSRRIRRAVRAPERRHRVPARAHRGHAVFRDGGRRPARIPSQRRDHHRLARDHPQGRQPRRARGVRDRAHAPAPEGHRRPQGAGLSARLRHVRRGMPQGRAGLSGRDVRGDDDRHDLDEARDGAAAIRRGRHHQSVRRHPHRYRRRPRRRARAGAGPVRGRAPGDGAGDARLGARHRRPQHRQSLRDDHVRPDAARMAGPQARRAEGARGGGRGSRRRSTR